MITKHGKDHLTLYDGEREHKVKYADFAPMTPHHMGGIHPGVTEDHHGWLQVRPETDFSAAKTKPVKVEHADLHREGKTFTVTYLPITAWLQAEYGPDKQIVSVPIDGDANAQRLHWLHRSDEEREEMKIILKTIDSWRLTEDGRVPEGDEYAVSGFVDHRKLAEEARRQLEEAQG